MKAAGYLCALSLLLTAAAGGFETTTRKDFRAVAGEYQGLYYDLSSLEGVHESSCYFSFTVKPSGSISGHLFLGGRGSKLSTYLTEDGRADFVLSRGNFWDDWDIVGWAHFYFDLSGASPLIPGRVSEFYVADEGWNQALSGYRCTFHAVTNPAPQAGSYTMVLPAPGNIPGIDGSGFATVRVDGDGTLLLNGTLPDGKPLSQRTRIASAGEWPVYVSLHSQYSKSGSILGWLRFNAGIRDVPGGQLIWTRPAVKPNNTRTVGLVQVLSSAYVVPPPGTPVLDFKEGAIIFSGVDLSQPVTNSFTLAGNSKVTSTSSGRFSLTFARNTGLFSGSFTDPVSRKRYSFKGAVLQESNIGMGLFPAPDKRTGHVWLGPLREVQSRSD